MMTIAKAAIVLRRYNDWRRGVHEPCEPQDDPKVIGESIDTAVKLLEDNMPKADFDSIIKAVTRETRVTEDEIVRKGRQREFVDARAIVCWLAYHYAQMTLTSIGKRIGRDHASIIHYNKMVDSWLKEPRLNLRASRIVTTLINELINGDTNTDNLSCPD